MANQATRQEQQVKPEMERSRKHALSSFEDIENFWDNIFPVGWPMRFERAMHPFSRISGKTPSVDVIDAEDTVIVHAELPGVQKKDLDVSVSDHTVTIKGEIKREEKEEKGDYYRCEIQRGAYSRTVALPAEVDGSKAKAKFKDGILELTLPKFEEAKRRHIEID